MLARALRSIRPANFQAAHISLVLVGLMWVLPFLHYIHENPLTTFYQEWWCALLGVLALVALIEREYWRQPETPRIVQLPLALAGIVLLQLSLVRIAYFDQALLYILYLLFAALMMLVGSRLRACFGIEKLSIALAFFLLAGAELSAMIGAIQHFQWHTPLDDVIVMQISSGLYGNLAQPNHFADYIALGLVSLGLLFHLRRLAPVYAILLSIPLLFAMTLSGSRSSWLYLLLMASLAWWMSRRDAAMRPMLRYCLLLVLGFGLMHLVVQLSFMAGADSSTTTVQRLLAYNGGGDTGGSIRLYLWREAWLMFMQHPLLGVGFGQFAWHHFQLLPLLRGANITGFYNNAHNLVFQLAAETGITGLLALFVPLGIWFYGLRRALPSAALWWGHAALGVLAIHSLLEYPFWYTYFLAIASILLGAFDETRYRLKLLNAGRIAVAMVMLLGVLLLMQMRNTYRILKETSEITLGSENASTRIRDGFLEVQQHGLLLSPFAEPFIFAYTDVNADHIKQKLALGSNVIRYIPIAESVYRQAFLLAQDGQMDESRRLLEQAVWSYPENSNAHQLLQNLATKDPAHFSGLLEFYLQKEQERARAVRNQ